jgi:UDP-N-acetylglucosamine--N-acetylmuramyl-(pentapeptide) pyrophosphoryl-undecaprenol N-acetylglucosamine transferase
VTAEAGGVARLLIAVSGTGGHIYPGIALAEELRARRPRLEILFAVARGKPGADWVRRAGFELRTVPVRGFSRRPGLSWLAFPFALIAGIASSVGLLASWRPDLVVGTGGYVAGPFVVGAAVLGIPVVLLEQNAIPGVTTRVGSLLAQQVHLADPGSRARLWRKSRAEVSGNPVRRAVEHGDGATFRRARSVPADASLVVVVGGSQGARALTDAAIDASRRLGGGGAVRMIVQTGAKGIEPARAEVAKSPAPVELTPFLDDMGGAYAAADLVVARAGAMTLAELAASGVPSILVPYPWATEDHQMKNAQRFAAEGAARVIPQAELSGERLAGTIRELLGDRAELARMSEAARKGEEAGARERIASACERFLG